MPSGKANRPTIEATALIKSICLMSGRLGTNGNFSLNDISLRSYTIKESTLLLGPVAIASIAKYINIPESINTISSKSKTSLTLGDSIYAALFFLLIKKPPAGIFPESSVSDTRKFIYMLL